MVVRQLQCKSKFEFFSTDFRSSSMNVMCTYLNRIVIRDPFENEVLEIERV